MTRVTHWGSVTPRCGTQADVRHVDAAEGAVTCRRCVYVLLAQDVIGSDDPRVTPAMREHLVRTAIRK